MTNTVLPVKTQHYLSELIRRKVISEDSLLDQMFINYLCNLVIDEDYLHIRNYEYIDEMF